MGTLKASTPEGLASHGRGNRWRGRHLRCDRQLDNYKMRGVLKVQADLLKIQRNHLDGSAAQTAIANLVPDLLKISKCRDFVLDRGHYFGTELPDHDKRALIEYMKTF